MKLLPVIARSRWMLLVACCLATANRCAADPAPSAGAFHAVRCPGTYSGHLQGVCTNDRDRIYWSFTTDLVMTDPAGKLLGKIDVADHHGDLCFHDGKLYVAVNLGEFNQPAGRADSWVYVYDADTLEELARHRADEVVHGAGGIGVRDGRFYVVGGLPSGIEENYVYEYDPAFAFKRRHVLKTGQTRLGIQTAAFADNCWWFGCYGNPPILLTADASLRPTGRFEFDAALGIVGVSDGKLLVARGARNQDRRHSAELLLAVPDARSGLRLVDSPGTQ